MCCWWIIHSSKFCNFQMMYNSVLGNLQYFGGVKLFYQSWFVRQSGLINDKRCFLSVVQYTPLKKFYPRKNCFQIFLHYNMDYSRFKVVWNHKDRGWGSSMIYHFWSGFWGEGVNQDNIRRYLVKEGYLKKKLSSEDYLGMREVGFFLSY